MSNKEIETQWYTYIVRRKNPTFQKQNSGEKNREMIYFINK